MQSLTAAPQMASPYTPVGGSNTPASMPQPPKLGTPIPGTTGGLAAKPGLSVFDNPLPQPLQSQPQQAAQQTQSYGRGDDSMLIHMTPDEVNSLRGLAQQFGGDLTTNPHTGLPEAGWLGKLLPTLLGGLGMAFGIPPVWMGALGAVGGTAITGDLKEGLMAGLGAFGGASLAGAAGVGSALGHVGQGVGLSGSGAAVMHPTAAAAAGNVAGKAGTEAVQQAVKQGITEAAPGALMPATEAVKTGIAAIPQNFAAAAKAGLSGPIGGTLAKVAVPAALMGATSGISGAVSGVKDAQTGAIDNSYQGPYRAQERKATFAPSTQDLLSSSAERKYFDVDVPEVYNAQGQVVQPGSQTAPGTQIWQPVLNPKAKKNQNMYTFQPTTWRASEVPGYVPTTIEQPTSSGSMRDWFTNADVPQFFPDGNFARGGKVHMDEGSFVMPARETAEFGKGSTDAGQRVLKGLGGIPIKGPGDGTSDSIPARIGGSQEARVADGEVYFPAAAVKRLGGGDHKKGTQKLYSMMHRAEQSRKKASRGGDGANLMRGLA